MLYPRKANEPEPTVESLANGKLLNLTLPDQTHWILLSQEAMTASDGPVRLSGTAAVVKRWNDGQVELILMAPGLAECGAVGRNGPRRRRGNSGSSQACSHPKE